jgi:hypothetical protein
MIILGDSKKLISGYSDYVVVSDPPYNQGYCYDVYKDRLDTNVYLELLKVTMRPPCVLIHYPEESFQFALAIGQAPTEVVSWVYPSNTGKQHRLISWFGCKPVLGRLTQPYKNPNDKRIKKLIAAGKQAKAYDWWEINQVKNVSEEKTEHPCQIPIEVMRRVITVTDGKILDPFLGSGTTAVACKEQNREFVGIELSENYFNIANQRLQSTLI